MYGAEVDKPALLVAGLDDYPHGVGIARRDAHKATVALLGVFEVKDKILVVMGVYLVLHLLKYVVDEVIVVGVA
jgi:hypothetical protein